jgi:glycosyltransferase involved in cell wall biosynthesis
LQRHGVLHAAVDAQPPALYDVAAKASAFWPRRRRWRERYEYSPVTRLALSHYGARRAARAHASPDALLQVGAYFDFSRVRAGPLPRLRCSFHDANLAVYSQQWTFVEDPQAKHIRRELRNEKRVFDGLDLVMTMSEWLRRSMIDDFGQNPDKVVTVGSGANLVELPELPPERDWTRPRLLFVGFEWVRKGGPELLAAFREVQAARPDAELWIVGQERPPGGPEVPGVRWLGRIDRSTSEGEERMDRLHREATLYLMPSRFEPMGNAFLHAMAYGLPCIGTRACSMPEIIGDGETGLLAEHADVDSLIGCIRALVDDPDRARAMGLAGRNRIRDRFTWDRVANGMVRAISERL